MSPHAFLSGEDLPEDFEKLIRIGRPAQSASAYATALVADSIESKSMKQKPRNSPSFWTMLTLLMVPQSLNVARSISSVTLHDRLPTKMEALGSPTSPLPAMPPGTTGGGGS